MIETSFYNYLSGLLEVAVYPLIMPQNAAPAVTYAKSSDSREQVFNGVSSLQSAQFDVDVWDTTILSARATAATIIDGLVGYRGAMGTDYIDNAYLISDFDVYEPETRLYRASLVFRINYQLAQA